MNANLPQGLFDLYFIFQGPNYYFWQEFFKIIQSRYFYIFSKSVIIGQF